MGRERQQNDSLGNGYSGRLLVLRELHAGRGLHLGRAGLERAGELPARRRLPEQRGRVVARPTDRRA